MNEEQQNSPKELVYVRPVRDDYYGAGDEISLIDLWLVLSRRKWMILIITAVCLGLGLAYALKKPVVYEYRTGVELAKIHGEPKSPSLKLLSPRESNVVLLQRLVIPAQRENFQSEAGNPPRIEVVKRGDDSGLELKTVAEPEKTKQVENLHQSVADALAEREHGLLQRRIEVLSKPYVVKASLLREQLEPLQEQSQRLYIRSDSGEKIKSLVNAQQIEYLREEIAEIRVELVEATSAAELIREASQPTRISYLAVESEYPVGTSKSLIACLSLILGLMAGIFLAFFSEFAANAKRIAREEKKQDPGIS